MELSEMVARDLKEAAEEELQVRDRHSLSSKRSLWMEYNEYILLIQKETLIWEQISTKI